MPFFFFFGTECDIGIAEIPRFLSRFVWGLIKYGILQ